MLPGGCGSESGGFLRALWFHAPCRALGVRALGCFLVCRAEATASSALLPGLSFENLRAASARLAWTRPAASQQAVIWAGPLCSGSPLWQRDCLTKRTEPKAGRFHVTSCYLQGIERGRDHSCASAAASRRIMAEVRGFPRSEQTFQNPPVAIGISAGWPLGMLWKVREACARQMLSLSCCPLLGVDRLVSEAARPESADLVPI